MNWKEICMKDSGDFSMQYAEGLAECIKDQLESVK